MSLGIQLYRHSVIQAFSLQAFSYQAFMNQAFMSLCIQLYRHSVIQVSVYRHSVSVIQAFSYQAFINQAFMFQAFSNQAFAKQAFNSSILYKHISSWLLQHYCQACTFSQGVGKMHFHPLPSHLRSQNHSYLCKLHYTQFFLNTLQYLRTMFNFVLLLMIPPIFCCHFFEIIQLGCA